MKPILFNTEMVKAIMEGKKTVTRRIIKNKYSNANIEWFEDKYGKRLVYMQNDSPKDISHDNGSRTCYLKSYKEILQPYDVGDILYVRETWKKYTKRIGKGENCRIAEFYGYKADEDKRGNPSEFYEGNWKPSIHMPKEAARIFLKVTNVRVERLQDITEEGAIKEGIRVYTKDEKVYKYALNEKQYPWIIMPREPITPFCELWNSTIKKEQLNKYSWQANPWVWVIEFERIEKGNENNEKNNC
ncbi:hypothetical protein [Clostridium tertium]|uniref:hypothetical protein n=1 Tax=Clostridium tertium TaxID=1559 RepID=UPI0031592BC5|nr:hypothetical protein [Clostridium tertium]